jgi:hypothetical protein
MVSTVPAMTDVVASAGSLSALDVITLLGACAPRAIEQAMRLNNAVQP